MPHVCSCGDCSPDWADRCQYEARGALADALVTEVEQTMSILNELSNATRVLGLHDLATRLEGMSRRLYQHTAPYYEARR